jgi:hypothetical protein
MARKKSKTRIYEQSSRSKKRHNPSLKASMKRKGSRLVHGYETARRKSKRKKR